MRKGGVRLFAVYLIASLLLPLGRSAEPARPIPAGAKVEWARVITRSGYWDRHAEKDPEMIEQVRTQTALNLSEGLGAANPAKLEKLCRYPFLFADNIAQLKPVESKNIAEYLRRGGFLLIDRCTAARINPDAAAFLREQIAALKREFPDLGMVQLTPVHEVFSVYFKMTARPPQTHGEQHPLYGIFDGERMVGIISLSGLQCAWCSVPTFADSNEAIRMVVNIYIYAMTRPVAPHDRPSPPAEKQ
jgi:hypothetical protein